ncbi:TPA: hypothetical protein NKV10_002248 [Vibrio parahaemolyticus]|nr:hypothetical protein [Vibrio parahaemolyticus]HCH3824576.1 hypothetical protein [Vibrio parahaemolyticus]
MKKSILLLPVFLSACATSPSVHWVADSSVDEFTDESRCKVTVGSVYTGNSVYSEVGKLYPFVEQVDGELRVGVMSGGKYQVPVGTVQLRIDSNKAWTITNAETPVDKSIDFSAMNSYYENLPEDQQQIVKSAIETSKQTTNQMLQPYTATTGDKARSILNEMLQGKTIIYRSEGVTNSGTTGKYELDESLKAALKQCKISV